MGEMRLCELVMASVCTRFGRCDKDGLKRETVVGSPHPFGDTAITLEEPVAEV